MARKIFELDPTSVPVDAEEIDGSIVMEQWDDGTAVTADGRRWYWYYEADTNYGEWKEYTL